MLGVAKKLANSSRARWLNSLLWAPLRRLIYPFYVRSVMRSGKTPVVIYQMGKVASKTIDATLSNVTAVQVFHVHLADPQNIQRRWDLQERHLGRTNALVNWNRSQAIYKYVLNSSREVKIITLIREPIGRNISAYYQGLDSLTGIKRAHERAPMSTLISTFLTEYPHRNALTWFDDEFRTTTGIDVYAQPFPRETGYQRIKQGHFDVLIMRHDLDDQLKATCIRELLDLPQLDIVQDNRADDKEYRDSYRAFQKAIHLSKEYIEEMLGSKYSLHFFSDTERQRLRDKWLR